MITYEVETFIKNDRGGITSYVHSQDDVESLLLHVRLALLESAFNVVIRVRGREDSQSLT